MLASALKWHGMKWPLKFKYSSISIGPLSPSLCHLDMGSPLTLLLCWLFASIEILCHSLSRVRGQMQCLQHNAASHKVWLPCPPPYMKNTISYMGNCPVGFQVGSSTTHNQRSQAKECTEIKRTNHHFKHTTNLQALWPYLWDKQIVYKQECQYLRNLVSQSWHFISQDIPCTST